MEAKPGILTPTKTWNALKTSRDRPPALCSKTYAGSHLLHLWYSSLNEIAFNPGVFSTSQSCFTKSSTNSSISPFHHNSSMYRPLCRNNSLYYQQPNGNVDVYAYSFYSRSIRLWLWNRLPEAAMCAPSICTFKPIALTAISAMSPPASLKSL